MELTSKLIEQIAFITRSWIKEQILIVLNKRTHEEYIFQPLQTNNEQFKTAVIFSTGYKGTLDETSKIEK